MNETQFDISKIEKDYKKGLTYKNIQEKYSITPNQFRWLIQKNGWKRKSNRSKAQKGNKNAKGNKGGSAPKQNKNAVTTGEYEKIFSGCFSQDEKNFFNNHKMKNKKDMLLKELNLLILRESRMMNRIQNLQQKSDMTISSMTKTNHQGTGAYTTTTTHAENTVMEIQKIEEALTRVQDSIRKLTDSLNKLETDNTKLGIEKAKLEIEKKRLELELQNADGEEIEDTSETDADIYGS